MTMHIAKVSTGGNPGDVNKVKKLRAFPKPYFVVSSYHISVETSTWLHVHRPNLFSCINSSMTKFTSLSITLSFCLPIPDPKIQISSFPSLQSTAINCAFFLILSDSGTLSTLCQNICQPFEGSLKNIAVHCTAIEAEQTHFIRPSISF